MTAIVALNLSESLSEHSPFARASLFISPQALIFGINPSVAIRVCRATAYFRRVYPPYIRGSLRGRRNHAFHFRGLCFCCIGFISLSVRSAQMGNSGSIEGVVKDPSGAAVLNVTVEIKDPVSGYLRTTTTNADGAFRFTNVPFNPYHLSVNARVSRHSPEMSKCAPLCPRKWKLT